MSVFLSLRHFSPAFSFPSFSLPLSIYGSRSDASLLQPPLPHRKQHLFSNLLNLTNPELDELIHEAEEEEFRDPNRDPTPNYDMQDHAEDEEADRDEEAEMGDEPNPIEVEAEEGSTQEKEAAAGADGGVRGTVGNVSVFLHRSCLMGVALLEREGR
jgi:hypothetical protein